MKQPSLARPRASHLRRHWPLAPGTVFLNHGSFGACPKPILELQARLRQEMEAAPVQFLWRRYEERLSRLGRRWPASSEHGHAIWSSSLTPRPV